MVSQIDVSSASFETLRALLTRVHSAGTPLESNAADFRAQSISDAVAISTNVSSSGLAEIFHSLIALTLDLLVQGYFIRGAIVRAPLYHDDNMVVGQALLRAYQFESEIAKFPRIVVTREVKNDLIAIGAQAKAKQQSTPSIANLRRSGDGPMYLNVLEPMRELLMKTEHPYKRHELTSSETADFQRLHLIRDKIQERYEEAMDTPRHFEKVRWFAQYWNEMIPERFNLRIRDADLRF